MGPSTKWVEAEVDAVLMEVVEVDVAVEVELVATRS
jgi:hypothetical protein